MYAIIRTGGKQAKVQEGDVLDIERVKGDSELVFTPLMVVDDGGKVTSRRKDLEKARVMAKVLGPAQGPKVDVFKYKAKSGYRRRQGHRQKYTRIEVTKIELKPSRAKKADGEADKAEEAKATAGSNKATGETSKKAATATKAKAGTKAGAKSGTAKTATKAKTTKKATAKTAGDSKKED